MVQSFTQLLHADEMTLVVEGPVLVWDVTLFLFADSGFQYRYGLCDARATSASPGPFGVPLANIGASTNWMN